MKSFANNQRKESKMSAPSYDEIANQNEGFWITDGPNSGGQEGWILYKGQMFFYGGGWGGDPPMVSPGISIEAFMKQYQNSTNPRVLEIVEELRKK
jgi:hypothetical protein